MKIFGLTILRDGYCELHKVVRRVKNGYVYDNVYYSNAEDVAELIKEELKRLTN